MKYSKGDYVKVKSDLQCGADYGEDSVVPAMLKFAGKVCRIWSKGEYIYRVEFSSYEDSGYNWTDEMFDCKVDGPDLIDEIVNLKTEAGLDT